MENEKKINKAKLKRVGGIALAVALAGVSAYVLAQALKKTADEKQKK